MIGVFLFLVEVIILVWVKFWEIGVPLGQPGKTAALVSTIAFLPFILMFFFFAFYFYRDFATNKYEKSTKQIKELESIIVRLEQNDLLQNEMNYCQNNLQSMNTCPWSIGGQDLNNNNCLNGNDNQMRSNQNKRKYAIAKQQQQKQFNRPIDNPSSIFLKKFCKNDVSSRFNDHLLHDNMKQFSVSVDQIDRNDLPKINYTRTDFGNDLRNSYLRNDFKFDDLYRTKMNRNTSTESADSVRFSLDNVSCNTYNDLCNNQLTSNLKSHYNTYGGRLANGSYVTTSKKLNTNQMKKSKNLTKIQSSSKSINSDRTIDDQQSNDSNRMSRKQIESFNNLSTIVV